MQAFGSKATGLELWNSDVDIVVLGQAEPTGSDGGGPSVPQAPAWGQSYLALLAHASAPQWHAMGPALTGVLCGQASRGRRSAV